MLNQPAIQRLPSPPSPRKIGGCGMFFVLLLVMSLVVVVGVSLLSIRYLGKSSGDGLLTFGERVAVVELYGGIYDVEDWVETIEECAERDSVVAVVLDIDSPGGAIAPTQLLCAAVEKVREEGKPVIASIQSIGASGGYYLASAADLIVANPGSLTGSIGVYMQLINVAELLERWGIRFGFIRRGEYKTAGDFSREMKPHEQAMFQAVIDDYYDQFIETVVDGRMRNLVSMARGWNEPLPGGALPESATRTVSTGTIWGAPSGAMFNPGDFAGSLTGTVATVLPDRVESASATATVVPDATDADTARLAAFAEALDRRSVEQRIRELAEGRIYTGRQAYQVGLVDQLGTIDDAVDCAREAAGVDESVKVTRKKQEDDSLFWLEARQAWHFLQNRLLYLCPIGL